MKCRVLPFVLPAPTVRLRVRPDRRRTPRGPAALQSAKEELRQALDAHDAAVLDRQAPTKEEDTP